MTVRLIKASGIIRFHARSIRVSYRNRGSVQRTHMMKPITIPTLATVHHHLEERPAQPDWYWSRGRTAMSSRPAKQDHDQEADRDDVEVLAEEEQAELHRRILGVEPADQFLLGLRQVERAAGWSRRRH